MSLLRYEKKSLFCFHSLFLYNLPSTTSRMGKNGAASSLTFTQLDCARLSLLWPACSIQTVRVFSPSRLHVVSGEEAENLNGCRERECLLNLSQQGAAGKKRAGKVTNYTKVYPSV